ncbi:YciI family protein [Roseateles sp. DC23W]|uniref:YciI family protein n=1 Tax=Pelomonas dachongensis TaxID=3299029 RepID=A0ABW7ELR6_9BURK
MPRHLISFHEGALSLIPAADFPDVGQAAAAAMLEAIDAGVFVFCGALLEPPTTTVVATDAMIPQGPSPAHKDSIGGITVIGVPSRDEAHRWASKIAAGCRCAQDVREFMPLPPAVEARIRQH